MNESERFRPATGFFSLESAVAFHPIIQYEQSTRDSGRQILPEDCGPEKATTDLLRTGISETGSLGMQI